METATSKSKRRFWVLVNYFSLFMLLFIFYFVQQTGMGALWMIIEILPLGLLIYSHSMAYGKTHLWKLTHAHSSHLDERERMVVYKAISISYVVFALSVLLLVYGWAIIGKGPIDVILAAVLLYLAHILPASIVAWNENYI